MISKILTILLIMGPPPVTSTTTAKDCFHKPYGCPKPTPKPWDNEANCSGEGPNCDQTPQCSGPDGIGDCYLPDSFDPILTNEEAISKGCIPILEEDKILIFDCDIELEERK